MIGEVEVKPSSLQIPISTISLTKSPLIWSGNNVIILTTQLKLCILELECSNQKSCMDLQFKHYALDIPESINPYIPSGPEYLKCIKSDGLKMANELSLPQFTSTCRRGEINLLSERISRPAQIGGELCHYGYRKTIASYIDMDKKRGCLFCTLTYDHKLWIVSKICDSYDVIHNLSKIWNDYIKNDGTLPDYKAVFKSRETLTEFIKHQCFYDIIWTPTYIEDNGHYSFLMALTGSSHIVLFKIPSEDNKCDSAYIENYSSINFSNISATYFLPIENRNGILVLASTDGRLNLYKLNFSQDNFITCAGYLEQICRTPIIHVYLNQIEDDHYLLLVARSNVFTANIIEMKDDSVIQTATTYEYGRFSITAIQALTNHIFYVTLSTGKVMKYNVNIASNFQSICLEIEELFNSDKVSFNGFALSPNKCLWAIFETVAVPYDHLVMRNTSSIHFFCVNKPETLYDFALNQTSIPIEWKGDVTENIRLYASRGLFNSLLMFLLNENVDFESINYLQNYYTLSKICSNTLSKKDREDEFRMLEQKTLNVQIYIVKSLQLLNFQDPQIPLSESEANSIIDELCVHTLDNNKFQASSPFANCMLCGKLFNDDSAKYICDICSKTIDEPITEETFIPYCSVCEITYSPKLYSKSKKKNCIYCNRALNNISELPVVKTSVKSENIET